jgi:hypothetical protein
LLTDLADKTGLTSGFVQALGLDRVRRPVHEPGRVAVDLAVLLAEGGEVSIQGWGLTCGFESVYVSACGAPGWGS